jgi:hypothetical protein
LSWVGVEAWSDSLRDGAEIRRGVEDQKEKGKDLADQSTDTIKTAETKIPVSHLR